MSFNKKDEFVENKSGQSKCWKYFLWNAKTEEVKCKECDKTLLAKGKSTSSMITHLKTIHDITFKPATPGRPSTSKSMKDYYKVTEKKIESPDEIVAKLAAVNGLTFGQIANSELLHKAFKAYGVQLPKSKTTVRSLLMENFAKVKETVMKQIDVFLSNGVRFSITLDEYTSIANRGFMNINLHLGNDTLFSLGAVPIESMPAEVCQEIVKER